MDHRVEYYDNGEHVCEFDKSREAYQFWLGLARGIRAKLFQNGQLAGAGTGLEEGAWAEEDACE